MKFEEKFPSHKELDDLELCTSVCKDCEMPVSLEIGTGYFRCEHCGSEEYIQKKIDLFDSDDIYSYMDKHLIDKQTIIKEFDSLEKDALEAGLHEQLEGGLKRLRHRLGLE